MNFQKIGIVGAGSWGTALGFVLGGRGIPVALWGHNPQHVATLRATRKNETYLPGVELPPEIAPTAELAELADADLVLFVTPSKAIREVARQFAALHPRRDATLLSCTKGLERGSGLRMSAILREIFPGNTVAVLSGPGHAEEVVQRMPTAVVLGCEDAAIARKIQLAFSTPFFRGYTSTDVAGIELGGALKNIVAIAVGISDGLGLGDNSKAALVTRALAEMVRLGVALGGRRETFHGLSGIGDLIVTCYSRHSRNRAVGEQLGRGEPLEKITDGMRMVAEGIPTTLSASECARKLGVDTPIIDQVRAILYDKKPVRESLMELLGRDPRPEQDAE